MAITAFTSTAIIDATTIGKTVLTASSEGIAADAIGLGATDDVTFNSVDAVDGDFSGRVLTTRLENLDGLSYIRVSGGTTSPIKLWRNTAPQGNNAFDMGDDAERFRTVYSVDGSFSGNLSTEVGGSQRVYNLGTEGDTDTEYSQNHFASNRLYLGTGKTGSGLQRDVWLQRGGSNALLCSYNTITAYQDFVPYLGGFDLGVTTNRWGNVASVGGDFSGDVIMAADVDFTGLPTADPVVAGRLWNDSGTLKISTG